MLTTTVTARLHYFFYLLEVLLLFFLNLYLCPTFLFGSTLISIVIVSSIPITAFLVAGSRISETNLSMAFFSSAEYVWHKTFFSNALIFLLILFSKNPPKHD